MTFTADQIGQFTGIIAALGLALPTLQAFIQRPTWSAKTKSLLQVGLSVLGGLVAYVATNGLDLSSPATIVTWVVGVYIASTTFYARLLRPTGVTDGIEVATSPTKEEEVDPEEVDPAELPEETGVDTDPPPGFDDGSGSPDGLSVAPEHKA